MLGDKIIKNALMKSYKSTEQFNVVLDEKKLDKKNLGIFIDIEANKLYLMDRKQNILLKQYTVATGKYKTPTPIGTFRIIQKSRWGEGFGTRWMRINVPWGQYGIHGTNKPYTIGYNASHGCVRMRNKDIEELYDIVAYNTPVVLFRGIYGAFSNGFRTIKHGDRGSDVLEVQKRLKRKGYYFGALDGIYGDSLKKSLHKFLEDKNAPQTDWINYNIYKMLDINIVD
ncbi:L,D-transpeptidase family protein [Clostridiaceae bacterium M8S5]|nr:L,D-transpeptidase family protein [Clostridiaceae bacterium M8S5]